MMIENNQQTGISSNYSFYLPQNKEDNVIRGIKNQIKTIQEKIAKISEDENLSGQEKVDMKKNLREQLDQLYGQLMERRMEIQKQKEKEKQFKNQSVESAEVEGTVEDIRVMNLISISSSLKQVSHQNATKTEIKGQARVLESEIKLDEARGVDVTRKKEKLSEINSQIEMINGQIQSKLKKVNDKISKVNKKEKEEQDKKIDEKDKDENTDKNKIEEDIEENKVKNTNTLKSKKKIDIHV
ncbi:FlxA-like family protein [Clostridium sp. D2Q-14]|uniref:FlxA-like family protein n=1 Tax=Anaeromonas gelatinilytica TaxID=2683194 RepID=UPI00193BCA0E|nr:FlxA-like family protein [Anaeromonas gelatinilytica]MBS4535722.1 FlxA-like family protein [Anaeromonas gelatinilytica]